MVVLVAREATALSALGVSVGVAVIVALSRSLTSIVPGFERVDVLDVCIASLVLVLIACVTSVLAALRAARIDPVSALRRE